MTDRFEDWINSMDEDEFIDRIDSDPSEGGFTDNQERIALTIREPVDAETLEELEREQESEVREVQTKQPTRVYDTRDLKPTPRYVVNERGDSAIVLPRNEQKALRQQEELPTSSIEESRAIQKRSILDRLKSFFRRKK